MHDVNVARFARAESDVAIKKMSHPNTLGRRTSMLELLGEEIPT